MLALELRLQRLSKLLLRDLTPKLLLKLRWLLLLELGLIRLLESGLHGVLEPLLLAPLCHGRCSPSSSSMRSSSWSS